MTTLEELMMRIESIQILAALGLLATTFWSIYITLRLRALERLVKGEVTDEDEDEEFDRKMKAFFK